MIAYLMAAGCALRLRPVTEKYAKCLLPINGSAIIDHWLTAIIHSRQFRAVYVNVHHCADQVEGWIQNYCMRMHCPIPVKIIDERSRLLGTAGTLFYHGEMGEDFLVVYTDTYSREFIKGLREISDFWRTNPDKPLAGLVTMDLPPDGSAGAIETDFMGNVISFEEKNFNSTALVGWAGIMFGREDFFSCLTKDDRDLARDVFPRLCGKIRAVSHVDAYDIGRSLDHYADADRKIFKTRSY